MLGINENICQNVHLDMDEPVQDDSRHFFINHREHWVKSADELKTKIHVL